MQTTEVFDWLYRAAKQHPRYISSCGGARSSKTFSALELLLYLQKYDKPGEVTSVVSETFPHLKRGAMRDFKELFGASWREDCWSKSDSIYTNPESGAIMEFFSVDSPGKVHGPQRKRLFVNEVQNIGKEELRQLAIRTSELIIMDYNPTHSFYVNEEIETRPDCITIHSTYRNNRFLSPAQIAEIEANRGDENWWRVYGEGKVGKLEGVIYDFDQVDGMPDAEGMVETYGMDFGFAADPSALVRCLMDTDKQEIWLDEVFYRKGMLNRDIAAEMEGIEKRATMVFADCAEPKTIAELCGYGWNVLPCYKATRKAEQIQRLRGFRLHVTKRSVNLIREMRGYVWAQDKDGRNLNEPVPFNDHCFVGNTKVLTADGYKPIKRIKRGELVLTRCGWRPVVKRHNNGYKKILDISVNFGKFTIVISCTPDHYVRTETKWKKAQDLREGDKLFLPKSLTGALTASMSGQGTILATNGNCTAMCGSTTTGRSPKGTKFIIRIATPIITKLRTWSASLQENILTYIRKGCENVRGNGCESRTMKCWQKPQSGIVPQRGGRGIASTGKRSQPIFSPSSSFVSAAARSSIKSHTGVIVSAQTSANQNGAEMRALITSRNIARIAGQSLSQTDIAGDCIATLATIQSISAGKPKTRKVYDLTIEGEHEYFANGILVHNCMDAFRYGVFSYLAEYGQTGRYSFGFGSDYGY